jgi:hypothetical protein
MGQAIEFMSKPGEQHTGKEAPEPKPPRMEEARRLIEEYADDLREIIKKLRRHLKYASPL